ncbi:hypothetical protein ACFC5T_40440 [Streptomyces sp. NPDC055961]|uniref:hypothetical protein n=1 Tax=Streptomyces sp. NPDC055961 TaxID=3345666 RepID=UPI0035D9ECDE
MVKSHGKKQRAKNKSRRTGAAYASAAAGTLHQHTPLPDMSAVEEISYLPDVFVDTGLAARLVAACRAGCQPCQRTLSKKVLAHEATLLGLASAIYGTMPAGAVASAATKAWAPLAQAATYDGGEAPEALEAFGALTADERSDLLEDALDHWAMGGLLPEGIDQIRSLLGLRVAPSQGPDDPLDAFREAGVKVFTLDDLDLGDVDAYHLAPNYGVMLAKTEADGRDMPMLTLYPETEDAGIEDLEARTDWEHWGLYGVPDLDPRWRLRARIADRSLQALVRVGPDGEDDIELWRAAETVTLPDHWWTLLDRVQHVLVAGPVKDAENPAALQAAGDAGELLAVVARVEFR